jgi:hypothetical protein
VRRVNGARLPREGIEGIRDQLDEQVRRRIKGDLTEGISGATAANVWSVLRTMFKESVSSRDRTMRLRDDDPTVGHKPPLTTPKRSKTFIYPVEFSRLLACPDVPADWQGHRIPRRQAEAFAENGKRGARRAD